MCDTKKSCYYKIFVILLKGDKTYLLARRDIKKGEEVTDFYGQHFFINPRNNVNPAFRNCEKKEVLYSS